MLRSRQTRGDEPPHRTTPRRAATLIGVALATAVGLAAAGLAAADRGTGDTGLTALDARKAVACDDAVAKKVPQPTAAQMRAAGLDKLPLAPDRDRVDLVAPPFTNPTKVTNPLFPISGLHSAILNGQVDGKPLRVETTLLPETRIMEWIDGQCVETLVSQYVAYLDGRIEEVALDLYAQADDGSVWYLGEDVFNYKDGLIADTAGTWHAGKEGYAALIMPAKPRVGDVHRSENIAGLVFEQVTIKEIGKTVEGPRGPVKGAIVGRELHDDGKVEDKIFAPGYGEFFTGRGANAEGMAVAAPTDELSGPVPADLEALSTGAKDIFDSAAARNWKKASATADVMTAAWKTYRQKDGVAIRLKDPTTRALNALARSVDARDGKRTRQAALDVLQASLDLELQYRPVAEIDLARFGLWLRQVVADGQGRNLAGVTGDLATLEWIRDRVARAVDKVELTRIDTGLLELRTNVDDEDLKAAADTASALRSVVAKLD